MDQNVKVVLHQEDTVSLKTGRGLRQECSCHEFYSINTASIITKQDVEGFGGFKIGVQVICNVKYADDIVLLAKGIIVVQSIICRAVKMAGAMEWK